MANLPSATKYSAQARPAPARPDQSAGQQQSQAAAPSIIPVGHEPRRQLGAEETPLTGSSGRGVAAAESIPTKEPRGKAKVGLRSPEKLLRVKDRLLKLRIFTMETMGSLRRAEITVWLAIFNCEFRGQATPVRHGPCCRLILGFGAVVSLWPFPPGRSRGRPRKAR